MTLVIFFTTFLIWVNFSSRGFSWFISSFSSAKYSFHFLNQTTIFMLKIFCLNKKIRFSDVNWNFKECILTMSINSFWSFWIWLETSKIKFPLFLLKHWSDGKIVSSNLSGLSFKMIPIQVDLRSQLRWEIWFFKWRMKILFGAQKELEMNFSWN